MIVKALRSLLNMGNELAIDERLCDLDYADDLLCLFESAEHMKRAKIRPP